MNIGHNLIRFTLVALLLGLSSAEAQQAKRVHNIGFLSRDLHPADSRAATPDRLDVLRQALRQLGYIEGENILVEYRYAEGRMERLPTLAQELIRLKPDLILADTATPARALQKATSTIPIVVVAAGNPIQSGLVTSLARPGGNVTGLTNLVPEMLGKRLELLKEVVPKALRFAFLDDDEIVDPSPFKYAQKTAQELAVTLERVEVKSSNPEFERVFQALVRERIDGLITSSGAVATTLNRKIVVDLLARAGLPAIHGTELWVREGGLMHYGANSLDLYRRAATYVDKILKGAKPGDLPIEQPIKFDFVINLKAAKQIGLTIPPNVLARADKVIR